MKYRYRKMSQYEILLSYLKQKCQFFVFTKTENRRAEQVLFGGLVPVGEGMQGEGVGGEYSENTEYTCM
jgi:hypothetical protein